MLKCVDNTIVLLQLNQQSTNGYLYSKRRPISGVWSSSNLIFSSSIQYMAAAMLNNNKIILLYRISDESTIRESIDNSQQGVLPNKDAYTKTGSGIVKIGYNSDTDKTYTDFGCGIRIEWVGTSLTKLIPSLDGVKSFPYADFTPGDVQLKFNAGPLVETATTYTTTFSFSIGRSGSVKVTFTLSSSGSPARTVYARIFKNGEAFGAERSRSSGTGTY